MFLFTNNRFTLNSQTLDKRYIETEFSSNSTMFEAIKSIQLILDFLNSEKGLAFILFFSAFICSYTIATILVGEYVRFLKLESKEFVTNRPNLHK